MQCVTCGQQNSPEAKTCAACGSPLDVSANSYSPALPQGVLLQNGAYEVGEELGAGGFGITYKGRDLSLRRSVAIKEFFPEGSATRQNVTVLPNRKLGSAEYNNIKAKFVEEAHCLAQFSHPGIVRVFSVFEENNTAYMVMELLEGQSLGRYIGEKGSLSEHEVVDLAVNVGGALSVVHEAGLIHRDIKPDNIMRTKDRRAVLIDFGTARAFALDKTVKHTAMLTPGYAPLEQYGHHARFGAFTDIYALGATLYHALTGEVPPPATDLVSGVELKAPRALNPSVSQGVSDAIMWAMEVRAADRPQHVQEFLKSLESLMPRPLADPSADKQLDEAKARANASVEKWKNVIAVVREAERTSGVTVSLPSRLTEGTDAATNQLKRVDWSTAVAVEKEATAACSEVVSTAKSNLQTVLAQYVVDKQNAHSRLAVAKSKYERLKGDAQSKKQEVVRRVNSEKVEESMFQFIGYGLACWIGMLILEYPIINLGFWITGFFVESSRLDLYVPSAVRVASTIAIVVGVSVAVRGIYRKMSEDVMKLRKVKRENELYKNKVLMAEKELNLEESSIEVALRLSRQKELAINQGLRLLDF